ncbi:hypothetical protein TREES_T100005004 [Tupaia chinensis]|uniref:Uncharacterized protein n=1 Tax=Tupaia chinensis TaxID=246437 RepID=L9LAP9_TUPCH|nr:hypothetical protein TREES_T100005004 [Tupaia chinensis]
MREDETATEKSVQSTLTSRLAGFRPSHQNPQHVLPLPGTSRFLALSPHKSSATPAFWTLISALQAARPGDFAQHRQPYEMYLSNQPQLAPHTTHNQPQLGMDDRNSALCPSDWVNPQRQLNTTGQKHRGGPYSGGSERGGARRLEESARQGLSLASDWTRARCLRLRRLSFRIAPPAPPPAYVHGGFGDPFGCDEDLRHLAADQYKSKSEVGSTLPGPIGNFR